MSSYAIFNYQFGKIMRRAEERSLFPTVGDEMDADEAFPQRQEILDKIIDQDFQKERVIVFSSKRSPDKEYIHRYVIKPTDHITLMRIANQRTTTIVTEELKEKAEPDYQNCIVIIDNRPGIQRILIENKKVAFQDVKQVAGILEYTLNQLLYRFHLHIELMHLQDPRAFWQLVNDKKSYPDGFYKITFHLPHLNLERLRKVFDRVLVMSREVFDSDLEWSYKANKNGALPLDENNRLQRELIDYMMSQVGDNNIKIYANVQKRKAIIVGKNSFIAIGISDTLIRKLTEKSLNGDLFGSSALDEIKLKTITGIDSIEKILCLRN